jgi:ATP-binding cassette subfamily B multidrug efflux pump
VSRDQDSDFACWFGAVPAGAPTVDFVAGLGRLVLGLVGFYVARCDHRRAHVLPDGWAGQHVLRGLQVEVFHHLHKLSLGFYSRHESGDLMSRITNDVSTIQQAISFALSRCSAACCCWSGLRGTCSCSTGPTRCSAWRWCR